MNENEHTLNDLIRVNLLPELYPNLCTVQMQRTLVKERFKTGLSSAFIKVGKQIFVYPKTLAELMCKKKPTD